MKKLTPLFAAFALVMTLAACSKKEEPLPVDTTPPTDQEPITPEETGLVTEEDTENTGSKTFDAALEELELTK